MTLGDDGNHSLLKKVLKFNSIHRKTADSKGMSWALGSKYPPYSMSIWVQNYQHMVSASHPARHVMWCNLTKLNIVMLLFTLYLLLLLLQVFFFHFLHVIQLYKHLKKTHASSSLFSRLHFSSRIWFPFCRDSDSSSSLLAFNSSFSQDVWPCSSSFSCSIRFSLYCNGKPPHLNSVTCL